MSKGPLEGLKVIEFASIGPGPHAAMLLADMGAEVLRIDRPGGNGWPNPIVDRGRAVKVLDIRTQSGRSWSRRIAQRADVVIEGLRPGVMERLGLGPDRPYGIRNVVCGEWRWEQAFRMRPKGSRPRWSR